MGIIAVFGVNMFYTYIYDILWLKMRYIFLYFALFFLALVAFWACLRIRTKGIGTLLFGVSGLAFLPIGISNEWILHPIMISPWGAVIWTIQFTAIGLSLDLAIWAFKPQNGNRKAIFHSGLLFSSVSLVGTMLGLGVIYISPQYLVEFLAFGYFLIPFALIEGILGGFAGCLLAKSREPGVSSAAPNMRRHEWYRPWTKRSVAWVLLGTGIVSCLIGAFTFFFDVYFMHIGYIFIYYVLPYAGFFIYAMIARLRVKGIGLIIFGLNGALGIPIDLYFEWFEVQTLTSPWGAVGWAGIYVLYGLSLDLSLWIFNPQQGETKAAVKSSLIFALAIIAMSIIGCMTLYKISIPVPDVADMLTYASFLVPSATLETMITAYLSVKLARKN